MIFKSGSVLRLTSIWVMVSCLFLHFSCVKSQSNERPIVNIKPNGYKHIVANDTIPVEFTSESLGLPMMHGYFRSLHWKDSLRKEDIQACILAMDSCRYFGQFHPNLMMPLLIHRIYEVLETDSLYQWEKYRRYLAETKGMPDEKYDAYLLKQIDPKKLKKFSKIHPAHYFPIDEDLLNVLVIRQSKLLRRGLHVNIELKDTLLDSYQKNQLAYSSLPVDKAIDSLFSMILNPGPVLSHNESALLMTLSSFGRPPAIKAIEYLKDTTYLAGLEKFGIRQLLNLVQINAGFYLFRQEQDQLLQFFREKKVYRGVFNEHRSQLAFIQSSITGQPWKTAYEDYGFYYDADLDQWRNIED